MLIQKLFHKIKNKKRKIKNKKNILNYKQNFNYNNEIYLYFSGKISQIYQIMQWYRVFKELNKSKKILIIVRDINVYLKLKDTIDLDIVFCYTINDLMQFYENTNPKVILYVNNAVKNFQSLIYNKSIHIHLNHGESEKASMHSNQCKAYDYTYIVGDAALDRYNRNLIKAENANFVKIGRPQYDFIKYLEKPEDKKVILYAPTDESTHISMRYTSLLKYGKKIVATILNNPNYQLIYRPHPNTGKNDNEVNKIHKEIITLIKKSKNAIIDVDTEALDLLSKVDLAIFDNSSLIIDFLYFNKPMLVTDMFNPKYHNTKYLKMLDACIMIDDSNINNLNEIVDNELMNDTFKSKREDIREYYLGHYEKGESTKIFINKILEAIEERDMLVSKKNF